MTIAWSDMFVLAVPIVEKVVRPVIVYAFLIAGFRLAGKRELAQLNPFDLVVILTISNTVQNAIIGNDNSVIGGMVGAATLLPVNHLVVRYLFSHESLQKLVEGEPVGLIRDGKVCEDQLRRELVTRQELEEAAHRQGFETLDEIDRATLE